MSCNFQKWPHFPCSSLSTFARKMYIHLKCLSKNASDERMIITTVNKTGWFSRKFLRQHNKKFSITSLLPIRQILADVCMCVRMCIYTAHSMLRLLLMMRLPIGHLSSRFYFCMCCVTVSSSFFFRRSFYYCNGKHNNNCVCVLSAHSLPSNWLNLTVQFGRHRHKKTTFLASSSILHSSLYIYW